MLIWNEVISMTLLEVSFSGAVFIIAVVIIRAIAINSLPKKTFLVLWEMVLLRLVEAVNFSVSMEEESFR